MQSAENILNNTYGHMVEQSSTSYGHMTYVPDKYDEVVDNFKHLRVGDQFRKLHIFHARRLGVDKFYQLAKLAEQEYKTTPGQYFTWLLKNEKTTV